MNQPLPHADSDVVEVRIPCKAEWVAVARLAVAAVASRMHFTIEEIEDVKLAVAEACTTIIQEVTDAAQIDIRCESDSSALRVRVRGSGDRAPLSRPRVAAKDEAVGGLGVFLIRALMDEVEYGAHAERGTELVMVKRLAS